MSKRKIRSKSRSSVELLTIPQVAEMHGVGRSTVWYAVAKSGALPGRKVGTMWLVARVDAEAWQPQQWLDRRREEPTEGGAETSP